MSLPKYVGVLGGGRMGAGIAHSFIAAGAHVTVVEIDEEAAEAAKQRVLRNISKSFEQGAEGTPDEWEQRLNVTTSTLDFANAELVVEAVPEKLNLKRKVFSSIATHAPHAIIATNTSSLSVSDLAGSVPNEVIGLHFFNPVPTSSLVEIVAATSTPEYLLETARSWVHDLGKSAVVVKDSPGLATSRLGVAVALEAIRMVEEGVASPQDIDTAMVLGYKFPIGPLALTDIVGLDVRLGIAEHLTETLGERFTPPQLLRDMVAQGKLGRKVGKGFYEYK